MIDHTQIRGRRFPYAPIGALHGFLAAIRNGKPPDRVDVPYLRAHALARGNEWAFISAVKFLGIVDGRGRPTPIFRRLQGSHEMVRQTLGNLVMAAYEPLFAEGADRMNEVDLRARLAAGASASQAANAARFFREVCHLAAIPVGVSGSSGGGVGEPVRRPEKATKTQKSLPSSGSRGRADLLDKLPDYGDWQGTAAEYLRLTELFLQMAQLVD